MSTVEVASDMFIHPLLSANKVNPPLLHSPVTSTGVSTFACTWMVQVSVNTVPAYANGALAISTTGGGTAGERNKGNRDVGL